MMRTERDDVSERSGNALPPTARQQAAWRVHIGHRLKAAWEDGPDPVARRRRLAAKLQIPEDRLWEAEHGLLPLGSLDLAAAAEALGLHPGFFFDDLPPTCWRTMGRSLSPHALALLLHHLDGPTRQVVEDLVLLLERKARWPA